MTPAPAPAWPAPRPAWVVALLLVTLGAELTCSIRGLSQTFDESTHLLAGYQYWRHRDLGANPEHPPLLKLVAALPLLSVELEEPPVLAGPTKNVHRVHGVEFLYRNSRPAGDLLFTARVAASAVTYLLALLVFLAASEMFGRTAGLLALTLLVFEPNVLAHGALITMDVAVTAFLFAAVYAWYRYATRPTAWRLVACGVSVGLALVSKHTAILLVGILPLLAAGDLVRGDHGRGGLPQRALRAALALGAVFGIALAVVWAAYTFRYTARPSGYELSPRLVEHAWSLQNPWQAGALSTAARWRILPEAYLWGIADVLNSSEGRPTFLLGRVYPTGQWFYFPAVFAMKTTLPMLGLLLAAPIVFLRRHRRGPAEDDGGTSRATWCLAVPAIVLFTTSMASGLNLGFRHILPVVPFLLVLAGAAGARVARQGRVLAWAVAALVVAHAVSSLRAYPGYLAYSNEAVGGPSRTHRVLTDSNVDWGQGLVQAARYLEDHGIRDCWFASSTPHVDPRAVGIPCRPLQSGIRNIYPPPHPVVVEGTVLVSASEIHGQWWGPGELNPYGFLAGRRPDTLIANSILVFTGRLAIPVAAAANRAGRARLSLRADRLDDAIREARAAVLLAPEWAEAQATLCQVLAAADRAAEAAPSCAAALEIADRVHPDYQYLRVPAIRAVAAMKDGARPRGPR